MKWLLAVLAIIMALSVLCAPVIVGWAVLGKYGAAVVAVVMVVWDEVKTRSMRTLQEGEDQEDHL